MPTLESRRSVRYTVRPPLPATFGRTPVLICNFGREGLQIEHEDVLNTNQRGIVECEELDTRAEGRILWSRLLPSATVAGHYAYRSGVQIDDRASERFERALAALLESGRALADNDSLSRKQRILDEKARQTQSQMFARPVTRARKLPDETRHQILEAMRYLQANPKENAQWQILGEANFLRSDTPVRHPEAVAIWEYLDHKVDLDTIARVILTSQL